MYRRGVDGGGIQHSCLCVVVGGVNVGRGVGRGAGLGVDGAGCGASVGRGASGVGGVSVGRGAGGVDINSVRTVFCRTNRRITLRVRGDGVCDVGCGGTRVVCGGVSPSMVVGWDVSLLLVVGLGSPVLVVPVSRLLGRVVVDCDRRGVVTVVVVDPSNLLNTLFMSSNARLDIGSSPNVSRGSSSFWILVFISFAVGRCSGLSCVINLRRSAKLRSHVFRLFNLGAISVIVTPIA